MGCVFLGCGYKIYEKPQIPFENFDPTSISGVEIFHSFVRHWSDRTLDFVGPNKILSVQTFIKPIVKLCSAVIFNPLKEKGTLYKVQSAVCLQKQQDDIKSNCCTLWSLVFCSFHPTN